MNGNLIYSEQRTEEEKGAGEDVIRLTNQLRNK
jgi:hypothetical protein